MIINTEIGPVEANTYWTDTRFAINGVGGEVRLSAPALGDLHVGLCKITVVSPYGGVEAKDALAIAELTRLVSGWAEVIDAATASVREEQEAERLRAEEERQRQAEERQKAIEARTQTLLHELVGERVNVRQVGYKTMRQAEVDVEEVTRWNRETKEYESAGYRPRLRYVNAADWKRTQKVSEIKRLDVKVPGTRKWRTVWEDGMDDLHPMDRDAVSLKPVQERYDGSLDPVR